MAETIKNLTGDTLLRKHNGIHFPSPFGEGGQGPDEAGTGVSPFLHTTNQPLKRHTLHIIPYFFTFIFCSLLAAAQPVVKASVDKKAIKIGEPITVKLSAVWPGHTGFSNSFIIPDSIPHFDIWDKPNAVIVKNGIEQMLTITSYDSGRFAIPSFKISTPNIDIPPPGYGTDSISINVMSVNVDSLKDYHDIKDIIEVPPIAQWPYILAIAAITIVACIALYFLLKKLGVGKKPARRNFENAVHPYQAALNALDKLFTEGQMPTSNCKLFFTQLTNIYRTYQSDAHNFRSYQQTGDELIFQAKPLLQQEVFFRFANTIRLSDAAKFAKYQPPKEEWTTSIKNIREAITAVEKKQIA